MPISNLKLASAILGIGGVATGASVGVYSYLNKSEETNTQQDTAKNKEVTPKETKGKAISEWLSEDNLILLKESEDDPKWKENWGKFIDANPNNNLDEHWTFAQYSEKKANKGEVPTEFKKVCEKNGKIEIENKEGSQYDNVKKYCSKEKQKDAT